MIEFFKDFFSSKEIFTRLVRAVSLSAAAAAAAGQIPIAPKYAWIPAFLAGVIAAGEKNKV